MTTKVLKIESLDQKVFWLALLGLALLLGSYVFLINDVIFNAAERQSLLHDREDLRLAIGQLESRHSDLAKTVTIELAYNLGFEEAGLNASFALIPTPTLALKTEASHGQ
ncbi:MAG: hypothetical protein AAB455_02800 [Patescibacteria group bacterium]